MRNLNPHPSGPPYLLMERQLLPEISSHLRAPRQPQGVFQTGTEAQYPQHAGSPRATASVGPSGELKRKAPPDDSADGRSPKKSGAPAKRGKHEDQSRAKMAMLEEYITMIKQVSVYVPTAAFIERSGRYRVRASVTSYITIIDISTMLGVVASPKSPPST